ncbi:Methyltransferase [Musa troglodytarum]|uniref:Methyltransferase n=1 Tax=Musa troglodytarum TaxID=320322 RepID=A0A9E7HB93_9LILI|nr:Methyltransferase [Musa troglodytarum]
MGNHLEFYFEAKFKAISEASKVTIDQQDNRAMGGAESPGHRSQEVQRPRRTSSSGREFKDAYCWTKAAKAAPRPSRRSQVQLERSRRPSRGSLDARLRSSAAAARRRSSSRGTSSPTMEKERPNFKTVGNDLVLKAEVPLDGHSLSAFIEGQGMPSAYEKGARVLALEQGSHLTPTRLSLASAYKAGLLFLPSPFHLEAVGRGLKPSPFRLDRQNIWINLHATNMAFGRSSRLDGRGASSFCSTTTIVVFVALCLVGVWMMTSSTVIPVQMSDTQSETNDKVAKSDSRSFENRSGDVAEDSTSGDGNENENNVPNESYSASDKTAEVPVEKTEVKDPSKGSNDSKNELEDAPKTGTFSDVNGEGGEETIKEAGDMDQEIDTGNQADRPDQKIEDSSKEAENDDDTKKDKKSEQDEVSDGSKNKDENNEGPVEEKLEQDGDKNTPQDFDGNKEGDQPKDTGGNEVFPSGAQSELLNETNTQNGAWSSQAAESKNEKEVQILSSPDGQNFDSTWKLCNVTTGEDYIPCLDNVAAIKKLHFTGHYEHRERHCPEEPPTCLVPLPDGYRLPVRWPNSREKIWYNNVPHTKLAEVKGHQNWVKVSGEYINFPGGGTQFIHAWGKRSRVVLDVGCGVASFGGYLFDRDVLTMSFAPKDEHEAQVQFALERGIPAISAVMGTKRLPFPSKVFDVVHCARCRVPWHIEGGMLLLELNRLLRPGGYFVWSATPVYRTDAEDVGIWKAMTALTTSMCWELVNKTADELNQVGLAIYRKPIDNRCYEKRSEDNPRLCQGSDDADAAWNVPLQACMHKVPLDSASHGRQWPEQWPQRLEKVPHWLNNSQPGVYGKPAPEDFVADYEHWKRVVSKSYVSGMGINWSTVRNVMDMRSVYGGFAAALRDVKVWVMNIVSIDSPDTLPVIYERGLFGMYHDWCESFSTYPRTYDLLHADHLFSKIKKRCQLRPVIVEVDRITRPGGKLIVRDDVNTIGEIETMVKSLQWEIRLTYSKDNEGLLCAEKTLWRPKEVETKKRAKGNAKVRNEAGQPMKQGGGQGMAKAEGADLTHLSLRPVATAGLQNLQHQLLPSSHENTTMEAVHESAACRPLEYGT